MNKKSQIKKCSKNINHQLQLDPLKSRLFSHKWLFINIDPFFYYFTRLVPIASNFIYVFFLNFTRQSKHAEINTKFALIFLMSVRTPWVIIFSLQPSILFASYLLIITFLCADLFPTNISFILFLHLTITTDVWGYNKEIRHLNRRCAKMHVDLQMSDKKEQKIKELLSQ